MSMANTAYDFIERTRETAEHYEKYVPQKQEGMPEYERFETTFLVNCLVGLLVLPQELRLIRQGDSFHSWGLDATKIINSTGNGKHKDHDRTFA